jgi:hypothetical protein
VINGGSAARKLAVPDEWGLSHGLETKPSAFAACAPGTWRGAQKPSPVKHAPEVPIALCLCGTASLTNSETAFNATRKQSGPAAGRVLVRDRGKRKVMNRDEPGATTMLERRRLNYKNKSKSMTSVPRLIVFDRPQLLEGEDRATYDQLVARVCVAVKPTDIIYERYSADVIALEWDVLRLRRVKFRRMRSLGFKALEDFLSGTLEYSLYSEHFADDITEILQDNLPREQEKNARTLARACARNEQDAVTKVERVLFGIDMEVGLTRRMDKILSNARARKAKELVQAYARGESNAINLVGEILQRAGVSMDDLLADVLSQHLDEIERIDGLIASAESRRNAALREIDRRHALLGETLRRSMQEIEEGEFEVIEPASDKGKTAA